MKPEIISLGGPLVEIMRKKTDVEFDEAEDFVGPFPSGDTPIFINAVGRLNASCGYIGVVGNDGFGRCITNRLSKNGVDISCIRVAGDNTTGTAFVGYKSDGSREFIFHWGKSAAGMISREDINPDYFTNAKWVHITGVTLASSKTAEEAVLYLLETLPAEVKVSFDPNIRPEVLSVEEIRALCGPVIERAAIIFPSEGEAEMLTGASTDEAGCREWADKGKTVVRKLGSRGSEVYYASTVTSCRSFNVEEVDPTGAGDSFCGGFITALNESKTLEEAALFANAVGALSIQKMGPMEGAPSRKQVEDFLQKVQQD